MITSTPTLTQFNPKHIPFQYRVIRDIRKKFDYSDGRTHEVLCSGSVGSAKSLLGAHLIVSHCLLYPGATALVGRKSMPSLKDTILRKILEHIGSDVEYSYNKQRGIIEFENGSTIIPYSWADGNYEKVRSLELSCAILEEITENATMDFYHEIKMRLGRLPHVPENFICSITNPGSPGSEHYKYFIDPGGKNRHVYYSLTTENPFLPQGYVDGLLDSLDERMAQRMVYGKWIDLSQDVIYYAYDPDTHYINKSYKPNPRYPIIVSWDFNIGLDKPLSAVLMQYIGGVFHVFDECVVMGQRTEDSCEEMYERGLLNYPTEYLIYGDATGRHRDTRSKTSDWDIIDRFFANTRNAKGAKIRYKVEVGRSNPPIRTRHNMVNGKLKSANGSVGMYVYKDAATVHEGLRLTKLRSGAQYLEDDSDAFQHITTALGYAVCGILFDEEDKGSYTTFKR